MWIAMVLFVLFVIISLFQIYCDFSVKGEEIKCKIGKWLLR